MSKKRKMYQVMNRRGFIGAITALAALTKVKPEPASLSYEKHSSVLLPDTSIIRPFGHPKRWSSLYTIESIEEGKYE